MSLSSSSKELQIGDVFTPLNWSEFAIERFRIFESWMAGSSVFDPTMGEGNLLESLVRIGLENGHTIDDLPIQKLYGNELNTRYFKRACDKFSVDFGVKMGSNFTNADILDLEVKEYDIVYGNPPWTNFNNLPDSYKDGVKKYFHEFDLIGNGQALLLGGSRIDIASLIIQKSIRDFLKPSGRAIFFLPLSILMNDGANKYFRTYKIGPVFFKLEQVIDLQNTRAFDKVGTRYGIASFHRGEKTTFPIPFHTFSDNNWTEQKAEPVFHPTDPLSVDVKGALGFMEEYTPFKVPKSSQPRQGLNTCGANSIFFFTEVEDFNKDLVRVNKRFELPKKYVHPLITSKNFKGEKVPTKWVLIPHNSNGKPLDYQQIKTEPQLNNYLLENKTVLQSRKGSIIGSWIKRGYWWAFLGVGPYSFTPYKVVWEAYGKKVFEPRIFDSEWQANQSLQAYMPASSLSQAERILESLQDSRIEEYLLSLKMEGTMNWAQPGKIKKLLSYEEDPLTLF